MQCIIIKATIQFGLIKIMETEPEVLFWQSLKILSLQPMNKSEVPWKSFHYDSLPEAFLYLTWG